MSKLRSINTHFWADNYVIDLDPIEKLLFLYLLTNDQTNMLGVYELNLRRIAFDTGIDKDMVSKIFVRFEKAGKAKYVEGYVILAKFLKHQKMNPNMKKSAIDSFEELPEAVKQDRFMEPVIKGLEGFGRVSKGSEPIAESESESEKEDKSKSKPDSDTQKPKYLNPDIGDWEPPTREEVLNYAENNGIPKESAEFYYDVRMAKNFLKETKSGNFIKIQSWTHDMNAANRSGWIHKGNGKSVNGTGLTKEELSL